MPVTVQPPEAYRAGLYIRLSKEDEQEGPSESVANQRSMLASFAAQQKLRVYDIYIDDGWSGTNFDRPAFQRLIRDIEDRKVNLVITKDLSRLGRDYILTGHYMERYFPEHRVRYISLLDGIDTGVESAANDITPFRALLNDMYAKDISKKIASVKHDKQRKGLFIGGKPAYGYQMHPTEKNRIVVDEAAASTVRRVFGMALDGLSCREIAARLNAAHVPSPALYAGLPIAKPGPYTGLWSSERIAKMLQNEIYLGHMVQARSRRVSYKSKKCVRQPREQWIIVPDTHEPLVDRATFDRVGMLLQNRRHTRTRRYDFLLKGLIFCHECGYPLGVINRKTARGQDCLYFVCRTYQRFTKAGVCTSHTIQEQTVTQLVTAQVQALCAQHLHPDLLTPIAVQILARHSLRTDAAAEGSALRAQLSSLTVRLDQIYRDKLSGLLDEADFIRFYENTKTERAALQARLSALEKLPAPSPAEDAPEPLVRQFLAAASTSREVLTALIERIELTAEREIILHFRFPQ